MAKKVNAPKNIDTNKGNEGILGLIEVCGKKKRKKDNLSRKH